MYSELTNINRRPKPYEFYTAKELWTDEHTSQQMLQYHLNESLDVASRNRRFIDGSVNWMASRFSIGEGTAVCDFGCGPGLYCERFARLGATVTGIDFSENSLRHARSKAAENSLDIDYICQDYLAFETDRRFDLITMVMCDFCALSPEQRSRILGLFRSLLNESGSVVLDVYSLAAYEERRECAVYERNQLNGLWSADDYFTFLNTFKYDDISVVLDKYSIFEENRSRTVYNWLQYFSLETLTKEFEAAGFHISGQFSDIAGKQYSPDSKEIAITANKC